MISTSHRVFGWHPDAIERRLAGHEGRSAARHFLELVR
jgi:hypothetical protein